MHIVKVASSLLDLGVVILKDDYSALVLGEVVKNLDQVFSLSAFYSEILNDSKSVALGLRLKMDFIARRFSFLGRE